ncbi:MAG: hypothetical protein Q9222_004839 [Ikaeria aurantiellina]
METLISLLQVTADRLSENKRLVSIRVSIPRPCNFLFCSDIVDRRAYGYDRSFALEESKQLKININVLRSLRPLRSLPVSAEVSAEVMLAGTDLRYYFWWRLVEEYKGIEMTQSRLQELWREFAEIDNSGDRLNILTLRISQADLGDSRANLREARADPTRMLDCYGTAMTICEWDEWMALKKMDEENLETVAF